MLSNSWLWIRPLPAFDKQLTALIKRWKAAQVKGSMCVCVFVSVSSSLSVQSMEQVLMHRAGCFCMYFSDLTTEYWWWLHFFCHHVCMQTFYPLVHPFDLVLVPEGMQSATWMKHRIEFNMKFKLSLFTFIVHIPCFTVKKMERCSSYKKWSSSDVP